MKPKQFRLSLILLASLALNAVAGSHSHGGPRDRAVPDAGGANPRPLENLPLAYFPMVNEIMDCYREGSREKQPDWFPDVDRLLGDSTAFSPERVSGTRRRLTAILSESFRPHPAMEGIQVLAKLRFIEFLSNTDLFHRIREFPLTEQIKRDMRSLESGLASGRQDLEKSLSWSQAVKEPALRESGRRAERLKEIVPNLQDHLVLGMRVQALPLAEKVWKDEYVRRAFEDYQLLEIAGPTGLPASAAQTNSRKYVFFHKLRQVLLDALWEDGKVAQDFHLSGFLFGGDYHLSPEDSSMIIRQVRVFGRDNAGMAYRIDPQDESSYRHNRKILALDSLADLKARDLAKDFSAELKWRLFEDDDREISITLDGLRFSDLFSAQSLIDGLADRVAAARGRDTLEVSETIRFQFPVLGKGICVDLAEAGDTARRKEAVKSAVSTLGPGNLNLLRLELLPAARRSYTLSVKDARGILQGKIRA